MRHLGKRTTILFTITLLTVALGPGADAWGVEEFDGFATTPSSLLGQADAFITDPAVSTYPLTAEQAEQELIVEVNRLSADLGFDQDVTERVQQADLDEDLIRPLAQVVEDLSDCYEITQAHWSRMPGDEAGLREVLEGRADLDPAAFSDIRRCSEDLWSSTVGLEQATASSTEAGDYCQLFGSGPLNLWPVLLLDLRCENNMYEHDYMLIVDMGGDDTYANNVASNMIDVKHPPPNFGHPLYRGPAEGCQRAVEGLLAADCIPAAAVLFDRQGADTYGVKQSPDVDWECTSDPVIRRMLTVGVGFLGAGILLDSGTGEDSYTGKTVSVGSGHIFGVGVLTDRAGNDTYQAIRNSEGFALVGGMGVLHDQRGNDHYGYYLPSGGVIDDTNQCDDRLRFLQGAGNVAGPTLGLLLDGFGNDTYTGGFSDDFDAPLGEGRGGSQGFGSNGAAGVFIDGFGKDTYTIDDQTGSQGTPERRDGRVILPDPLCGNSACSGGLFVDGTFSFSTADPCEAFEKVPYRPPSCRL